MLRVEKWVQVQGQKKKCLQLTPAVKGVTRVGFIVVERPTTDTGRDLLGGMDLLLEGRTLSAAFRPEGRSVPPRLRGRGRLDAGLDTIGVGVDADVLLRGVVRCRR